MSDCCTPGTGFPNAALAQQLATNNAVVWEEICMLQQAILKAASLCNPSGNGEMCTTVGGATPMTFVSGITSISVESTSTTSPTYESISATAAQTVVNTTVTTTAASSGVSYLLVFVNGIVQMEGSTFNYTVTGTNQITFTSPLTLADDIAIYSYVGGITIGGGSGYFSDSPAVSFVPPVGAVPSILATGTVTTNGSNIFSVNITNGGLGYEPIPATMSVSSLAGVGANLQPLVDAAGRIVSVNVIAGGTGYTTGDIVTATRAVLPNIAYVNATFLITSVGLAGEIIEVAVLNPGNGYQDSVTAVVIVSTLNPLVSYPLGAGFFGTVFTAIAGTITNVIVNNTGAGYAVYPPYLVITDQGTGAVTQVTLNGTSVASIDVISPGTGYTASATGVVFNPPTALLPNPPANPAVVDIVVAVNTYGTNPNLYYQVWAGTATNKAIQLQMNTVLSYFKGLGYTIKQQINPVTGSTLQWKICW